MRERDMTAAELLDMHLNYGPGGNDAIDAEVWRRWPDLWLIRGRHEGRREQIDAKQVNAGAVDYDDLAAPNPEQAAEYDRYQREYAEAVEAIRTAEAESGNTDTGTGHGDYEWRSGH